MQDYIDKRDQRDKMFKSIVKRRNVVYQPIEEDTAEEADSQIMAEDLLQKMKEEKERKLREQIEAGAMQQELDAEEVVRRMKEEAERKHRASVEANLMK